MASSIEREIRNLLNLLPTKNQVADELLKKWHRGVLSNTEKDDLADFLYRIGFHKSLLSEILFQMEKRAYVPVKVCMKLINRYAENISLSKQRINAFYLWAESLDATDDLIRMEELVSRDSRLEKLRELSIDEDLGHGERQFQARKRNAFSLVADNLFNKADKELLDLLKQKPEDQELIELNKKLQYEKAIATLKKQSNKQNTELNLPLFPWKTPHNSMNEEEEEKALDHLLQLKEEKPEWSFDIAIALFCVGKMEEAYSLLETIEDHRAFWLKIDILLETRRYVQAIDELDNYEIDTSSENYQELNFSVLFLKAKALWGADQKEEAISCMEEIIKVRPDYRVAESLYYHWKSEVSP